MLRLALKIVGSISVVGHLARQLKLRVDVSGPCVERLRAHSLVNCVPCAVSSLNLGLDGPPTTVSGSGRVRSRLDHHFDEHVFGKRDIGNVIHGHNVSLLVNSTSAAN